MSNENDPNGDEPQHIKDLREKASGAQATADENKALIRKMAFMEAGIDTTSKPAQAFLSTYAGDLTPEAIKAEAIEWNLAPAAGNETPPAPVQGLPQGSPELEHQQLTGAGGGAPAPTPDPPPVNGVEKTLESFKSNLGNMSRRDAETVAFGDLIRSGIEGQPGARFDRDEWTAKQAAAGHGAEFAG